MFKLGRLYVTIDIKVQRNKNFVLNPERTIPANGSHEVILILKIKEMEIYTLT